MAKRSKRYLRAMLRAIDLARKPDTFWDGKRYSKTYGLRVIKTFERVNGVPFDPFNGEHLSLIEGNAHHEHFFRTGKQLFKRLKE